MFSSGEIASWRIRYRPRPRSRPRSAAIFIERSIREITRSTLRFTLIERQLCILACFEDEDEDENDWTAGRAKTQQVSHCRTAERVSERSIITQFGSNGIEKLPLSATCFDSERSPGAPRREHFVLPLPLVSLCRTAGHGPACGERQSIPQLKTLRRPN